MQAATQPTASAGQRPKLLLGRAFVAVHHSSCDTARDTHAVLLDRHRAAFSRLLVLRTANRRSPPASHRMWSGKESPSPPPPSCRYSG